jgi:hypothetical protein
LIDISLKEHWWDICLEHLDKSALVEHHTAILSTKPRYIDCIIRELSEIKLHPSSVNRKDGFCLSKWWKSLICSLKECRKPPSYDSSSGFSVGSWRFVHPALCSLQALISFHPDVSAFFHYVCSLIPHRMPATHSLELSLLHIGSLPNTPLHFSRLSPRPAKRPIFRAILNSCSCLLLFHSVVLWEPIGFILPQGEPVGTDVHSSISLLLLI